MSKKNQAKKKRSASQIVAAFIAAFLAFLMLWSVFGNLFFISGKVTQKTVDDLKDKLAQAASRKKELQSELNTLKNDKSALKKKIEVLDENISTCENEIELQTQLITELDSLIAQKEVELAASQQDQDDQYEKLKARLRFMVENGSTSYLQILLSADSFSDFLSKYEIVSQITDYEKELFLQFKQVTENVNAQKLSLEDDRATQLSMKAELEENKSQLEREMTERNSQMIALESAESEVKKAYEEIDAEEDKISAEIKKAVAELAKTSTYVGGTFLWPLPSGHTNISSPYGYRTHPITKKYKLHTGTDITASSGTKIFAANSGTVITSAYSTAYGNYVVIDHGGGVATLYAHMSKRAVSVNEKVSRGQVIGYVGSTGYSTGPHLHFEIIKNGSTIDPMTEFKKAG